ncbi:MAG: NAD-dependent epimerase/dehydratase family protein [Lautropia sp.]
MNELQSLDAPSLNAPVLVTGAAGFIGMHVSIALLRAGVDVVGVDLAGPGNLPILESLRRDRLREIERIAASRDVPGAAGGIGRFTFRKLDIADPGFVAALKATPFDRIVHLAAQAGVRYSIERPDVYVRSNLVGMANMLELARQRQSSHFVFASSSSVYGGRNETPFKEPDRIDRPVSFYAATKVANEAMAASYSQLFKLPMTGLRFFTVYGPWGRPDMAPWLFTEAILKGQPIKVFGKGELLRDFTYIDDIVEGVCRVLRLPPRAGVQGDTSSVTSSSAPTAPFTVFNIGNNRPSTVNEFIVTLERLLDKTAIRNELPIQPGDVPVTCASIDRLHAATGFTPVTPLATGLGAFCEWLRSYRGL